MFPEMNFTLILNIIIKVGSKKVELQAEVLDIFRLSVQHNYNNGARVDTT